ncbi:MAG: signal peptidase II [Thermodesulfobacteriota bacterium]
MRSSLKLILIISVSAAVLDQLSKAIILAYLPENAFMEIIPGFFDLVHFKNPGAAFGILRDNGQWKTVFLSLASVAAIVIIGFLLRDAKDALTRVSLSLIAGGAVGNLVDRIRFGTVIDFLDFHVRGLHWPAFNVADSCITIGVALAIINAFSRKQG